MPSVHTELSTDLPPPALWRVLVDTDAWGAWNPAIPVMRADPTPGGRVFLEIELGVGRRLGFSGKVLRLEAGRELTWGGGVAGLFSARHGLRLEPTDDGTKIVHTERFAGLFAWLLWPFLSARLPGAYDRMNEALAAEAARRARA